MIACNRHPFNFLTKEIRALIQLLKKRVQKLNTLEGYKLITSTLCS